jgi:hypothetical protein
VGGSGENRNNLLGSTRDGEFHEQVRNYDLPNKVSDS